LGSNRELLKRPAINGMPMAGPPQEPGSGVRSKRSRTAGIIPVAQVPVDAASQVRDTQRKMNPTAMLFRRNPPGRYTRTAEPRSLIRGAQRIRFLRTRLPSIAATVSRAASAAISADPQSTLVSGGVSTRDTG
jgi:hypothetical protein